MLTNGGLGAPEHAIRFSEFPSKKGILRNREATRCLCVGLCSVELSRANVCLLSKPSKERDLAAQSQEAFLCIPLPGFWVIFF